MNINFNITDEELMEVREFLRQWQNWESEYFADLGRDDVEIIGKVVNLWRKILIDKILEKM